MNSTIKKRGHATCQHSSRPSQKITHHTTPPSQHAHVEQNQDEEQQPQGTEKAAAKRRRNNKADSIRTSLLVLIVPERTGTVILIVPERTGTVKKIRGGHTKQDLRSKKTKTYAFRYFYNCNNIWPYLVWSPVILVVQIAKSRGKAKNKK